MGNFLGFSPEPFSKVTVTLLERLKSILDDPLLNLRNPMSISGVA